MEVINLFAGPGAGKSTTAAGLFNLMKLKGVNCELITEYAKQMVWDERFGVLKDQLYLLAKQNRKLEMLKGKVDYVITDSPLLLSLIYVDQGYPKSFIQFVLDLFKWYDNTNIFIKRVKPYKQEGRIQDEIGARRIDIQIKELLNHYNYSYHTMDGDESLPQKIYDKLFLGGKEVVK